MSQRRRALAPRDQAASSFSGILMGLCEGAGALAVALVDQEGETVDYAGYVDPYSIRVTAAEWRLVLRVARAAPPAKLPRAEAILVRCQSKSYAIVGLPDGYALVLELPRRSFGCSRRAVAEAVRAIELEASLDGPASSLGVERWFRVEVRTASADRRRPEAVWHEGSWRPIVVLGRHHAGPKLPRPGREVAFRARFPTGLEFTLVREPTGRWFADAL